MDDLEQVISEQRERDHYDPDERERPLAVVARTLVIAAHLRSATSVAVRSRRGADLEQLGTRRR
jgi:hypothetical protein